MNVSLEAIELLTKRTDWIRALARRLVGDAHLADDIAQDAAVAALRDAPAARRVGPSWLAGIVHNVANNLRRRHVRRMRHERSTARQGEAPSAAQAAAIVEQQRLLADLVLGLGPEFRDVVLLRFFEGATRREIARRLGIKVATVNSRLARAMAKLRAQLDARHGGDRRHWVAALAPLALRIPIAGGLSFGALVMKKPTVVATILAALFGATVWLSSAFTPDVEPPSVATASSVVTTSAHTTEVLASPPATRTELPATTAASHTAEPRVRVVDALTAAPEPEAEVRLVSPELAMAPNSAFGRQIQSGELDLEAMFLAGERQVLGEDASLAVPTHRQATLFARQGDRMGALELGTASTTGDFTLRLWPLQTLRATVVDAGGRVVPGVPVELRFNAPGQRLPVLRRSTDATGVAILRWIKPMFERIGAHGRPEAALGFPGGDEITEPIDPAAKVVDVQLRCPPVGRIVVNVRRSDGTCPTTARVGLVAAHEHSPRPPATQMMQEGRAEFWPVAVGCQLRASAWYGNRLFTQEGIGPTVGGETVTLTISVGESVTVVGRVVSNGKPKVNTTLYGTISSDGETQLPSSLSLTTDQDGRFRCEIATIDGKLTLELRESIGPNHEARVAAELPAHRGPQPIDLGDLELTAQAPFATGTVVSEDGTPVGRAHVEVLSKVDTSAAEWAVTCVIVCDQQGRFTVPAELAREAIWLRALSSGPLRHEPEACAAGARDLQLTLRRAGALAGQLSADPTVPLEHITAALWNEGAGPMQRQDLSRWQLATVDVEGRFRFDALAPGSYTLALSLPSRHHGQPLATIPNLVVTAGVCQDRRLSPLDLSGRLRAVRLRVHSEDGQPLRADTFLILGEGQTQRIEYLGQTDRPLLLTTEATGGTLIVEADGHFAARVDLDATDQAVELRRGMPVAVVVSDAPTLTAPLQLRAALQPVTPTATSRRARGYRQNLRPDHGLVANGQVALRVPEPGDYRLRLFVQREEGGFHDEIDVTPGAAASVRVEGAGARLVVAVDTARISEAVATLRARQR